MTGDMAKRMNQLLNNNNLSWQWCFEENSRKQNLSFWLLSLFLLEDLLVRLNGLDIPNLIKKDIGLDNWLREIGKISWLTHE